MEVKPTSFEGVTMKKLKGFTITQLSGIAITFVVAAFVIGMGAQILSSLAQNTCDNEGYNWESDRCWSTYNASGGCPGDGCVEWSTGTSLNVTNEGREAMETFGQWLPSSKDSCS